jgi:DNA relaxase NicK
LFVDGSPKGRTLYAGSRTSECYLRIYEYRKFHGHGAHVSVELEFKPQGPEAKLWAFTATAREILGRSPLVTELLATVGIDISRTVPRLTTQAPSSLERATTALLHQYGKLLRDRILPTLDGDATRLGPHLLAALSELERHRQAVSAAADNRASRSNEAAAVG